MAGLNFKLSDNASGISSNKPALKPWGIYNVKLTKVEKSHFAGKKDPSKEYDVLRVRFEAPEGYYEETIFFPNSDKDMERTEFENTDRDGKPYKTYMASNVDRAMYFCLQLVANVNPDKVEAFKKHCAKADTFDSVVAALIKLTKDACGVFETKLKLNGRTNQGQIVACLPTFCRISRDGDPYMADNFIGESVGFSPYEEGKRAAYLGAAATPMADSEDDVTIDTSSEDDDFNLDDIDLDD